VPDATSPLFSWLVGELVSQPALPLRKRGCMLCQRPSWPRHYCLSGVICSLTYSSHQFSFLEIQDPQVLCVHVSCEGVSMQISNPTNRTPKVCHSPDMPLTLVHWAHQLMRPVWRRPVLTPRSAPASSCRTYSLVYGLSLCLCELMTPQP
jgi:hypothetical protein